MSVAEIGQLHGRYVRLSDKFKSIWTYNQLISGVFRNLLNRSVPYDYDFQSLYEKIRAAGEKIQTANPNDAAPLMTGCDAELDRVLAMLLEADTQVTPSILRRFFEKLRSQDEKIIFNVVKFYLYAKATTGEQRDKLDFLLTKLGESWLEDRGEFVLRDRAELRRTFLGLFNGMEMRPTESSVASDLISEMKTIRDQINRIDRFEDLSSSKLLSRGRELKQQIADAYFDPEVLIAIIDANIATKNRFAKLYQREESRLLEDAQRLLENEQSIARGFGEDNPEILDEIQRFKSFKEEFDQSRAESNVKHDLVANLRRSLSTILQRLDDQFDATGEVDDLDLQSFLEPRDLDTVQARFGDDALLQPYLLRIVSVLDSLDPDSSVNRISSNPAIQRFRLEPWEVSSFEKIYWDRPRGSGESDELLFLFVRGAALRIRIDEQARELAEIGNTSPSSDMLERVRATLDRSRELDETFKEFLQEQIHSQAAQLHRVYRSRLRLLRAYSGLWLIYDQHTDALS